jgi:hypothetical protein
MSTATDHQLVSDFLTALEAAGLNREDLRMVAADDATAQAAIEAIRNCAYPQNEWFKPELERLVAMIMRLYPEEPEDANKIGELLMRYDFSAIMAAQLDPQQRYALWLACQPDGIRNLTETARVLRTNSNRVRTIIKLANSALRAYVGDAEIRRIIDEDPELRLELEVDNLGLAPRTLHVLKRYGVNTLGELLGKSEDDLLDMTNIGLSGVADIKASLERYGLFLKG